MWAGKQVRYIQDGKIAAYGYYPDIIKIKMATSMQYSVCSCIGSSNKSIYFPAGKSMPGVDVKTGPIEITSMVAIPTSMDTGGYSYSCCAVSISKTGMLP